MPLSNGKYVSPEWKNGQAPAIDATELQAITDAVASLFEEDATVFQGRVQVFTQTQQWTAPADAGPAIVLCISGGGGGGGGQGGGTTLDGKGGNMGVLGHYIVAMVLLTPGTTYTVTVGAAGKGGAPGSGTNNVSGADGSNGTAGGKTSFGSHLGADAPSSSGGLGGKTSLSPTSYTPDYYLINGVQYGRQGKSGSGGAKSSSKGNDGTAGTDGTQGICVLVY